MSSCTLTYGLPYQTCADAPCDIPDTLCSYVDIVDDLLLQFDNSINRTYATVPMAVVRQLDDDVSFGNLVHWQFVRADTDNMIDLAVNDTIITSNRDGYWATEVGYIAISGTDNVQIETGVVHLSLLVCADDNFFTVAGNVSNFAAGTDVQNSGTQRTWAPAVTALFGSPLPNLSRLEMGVWWHADLGVAP